ncbi:hypothetical protein A9K65_032855 (plasmid) [Mesorhizobium sp. WSM1497]|uniref:hypothetical protein n=1 Tax=Mesorhizobium sp. WSM1497 TaxID=278153 RepID=UPI0007EDF930|nr:hypothetical protein [Mesorhizobium sp. WSM1497]ARP68205.1 hypothetical protein A9K65_032855 [Mesorhizobium sp. WSM1497]
MIAKSEQISQQEDHWWSDQLNNVDWADGYSGASWPLKSANPTGSTLCDAGLRAMIADVPSDNKKITKS